jgi:hypothetical protein
VVACPRSVGVSTSCGDRSLVLSERAREAEEKVGEEKEVGGFQWEVGVCAFVLLPDGGAAIAWAMEP